MHLLKFLLFLAGLYAVYRLLQYVLTVNALLGLRFKRPSGELKAPQELPEYLHGIFDTYQLQLEDLGFRFSHSQIFDNLLASAFSRKWNIVLFDNNNSYANIAVSTLPEPYEPAKVEFVSIFTDGRRLVTVNGSVHNIIGEIPNTTIVDPYAPTLEEQLNAHLEKLDSLALRTVTMTPADFLAGELETADAYFDWLNQHGYLKSHDEQLWRLRLPAAMRFAFKSIRGLRKLMRLRAAQRKTIAAEQVDVPIEVEVEAFLRLEEVLKPSDSGFGWKLMVALVSATLAIGAFGVAFSFEIALWLVAALFVHELGHYIGMAIFRFADRQILFLPFIGAATLGTKTDATALQRAVVYVLGPAVGLVAGSACLTVGIRFEMDSLKFCGAVFLILNYLNLLPIVPLDGGRLFEAALFSRVPVLKSTFYIMSVVLLATGAILLRDPIVAVIALFMFAGARGQILLNIAQSKLNKQVKTQQIERSRQTLLPVVLRTLRQKRFARLPFARRFAIGRNLVNNLLQRPPDAAEMILSLVLYMIVISLPIFIAFSVALFLAIKQML
jgi:Zn-dependent protease